MIACGCARGYRREVAADVHPRRQASRVILPLGAGLLMAWGGAAMPGMLILIVAGIIPLVTLVAIWIGLGAVSLVAWRAYDPRITFATASPTSLVPALPPRSTVRGPLSATCSRPRITSAAASG